MTREYTGNKYANLVWRKLRFELSGRDAAQIECTVKRNGLGQVEQITHRWVGKSPFVFVAGAAMDSAEAVDYGDSLRVGPYKLVKLERYPESDQWLCVRSDKLGWLRVFLYRSTRWLDWFYRRSIVVLVIYGAAERRDHAIPSWRDIYVLKWLAKVVK